jgi:hypothetical protein
MRRYATSAAIVAAFTLATAAPVLAQSKDGTFKGTYTTLGTYKAMPVERSGRWSLGMRTVCY